MCVTVMKVLKPTKTQIETLKQAVQDMGESMQTLKSRITDHITDQPKRDALLSSLDAVIKWQATINGDDGWYWFPVTWDLMYQKLCAIKTGLTNIRNHSLNSQCATCKEDMNNFKTTCEGIPGKDDSADASSKSKGLFSSIFRKTKLDQLKALAS